MRILHNFHFFNKDKIWWESGTPELSHLWLVGEQNNTATFDNLVVSYKTDHPLTI